MDNNIPNESTVLTTISFMSAYYALVEVSKTWEPKTEQQKHMRLMLLLVLYGLRIGFFTLLVLSHLTPGNKILLGVLVAIAGSLHFFCNFLRDSH